MGHPRWRSEWTCTFRGHCFCTRYKYWIVFYFDYIWNCLLFEPRHPHRIVSSQQAELLFFFPAKIRLLLFILVDILGQTHWLLGRRQPSLKMDSVCFSFWCCDLATCAASSLLCHSFSFFIFSTVIADSFRDCAVQPLLRHCFLQARWPTLAWFVCHQAVESPSHGHRFSVNLNCGRMCVSMWWIRAENIPGKTGKQWCERCDVRVAARVTQRECFYWPEECEIVCRSSFANVNIVFLICLIFIFERPIQILLFRIHLVSVSKVCYLPSPFLDKLLTHIHEWINSDNNCWSSISDTCNEAEGMLWHVIHGLVNTADLVT